MFSPESLGRRYCSKKTMEGVSDCCSFPTAFAVNGTLKSRLKKKGKPVVSFTVTANLYVLIPQPPLSQEARKKHTCLHMPLVRQCSSHIEINGFENITGHFHMLWM